mmetsp:Transcript_14723/g.44276  ORF Transcript_14723/g.44276 Transcript_14723/m.44276 type:complete len:769 (-) Transcript_14723:26-2332(-)
MRVLRVGRVGHGDVGVGQHLELVGGGLAVVRLVDARLDGVAVGLERVELAQEGVLRALVALVGVEPVLHVRERLAEHLLLLRRDEVLEVVDDGVALGVDVRLEVVADLVLELELLVPVRHLGLELDGRHERGIGEARRRGRHRQLAAAELALLRGLLLAARLRGVVPLLALDVHGVAILLRVRGRLLRHGLEQHGLLHLDDAGHVRAKEHLDLGRLGILRHARHAEARDGRIRVGREAAARRREGRLRVRRRHGEGRAAAEHELAVHTHVVAAVEERLHARGASGRRRGALLLLVVLLLGVVRELLRAAIELQLHGEGVDVLNVEGHGAEHRREQRAAQRGAARHGLVGVHRRGDAHALAEHRLEARLDGAHAGGAAHHLDGVELGGRGDASLGERLLDGRVDARDEVRCDLVELLVRELPGVIIVVLQELDVDSGLLDAVRRNGLLRLLRGAHDLVERLRVLLRVAGEVLKLGLEFGADLLGDGQVEEAPAERAVRRGREHAQLAIAEGHHGCREVARAHVQEEHLEVAVVRELLARRTEDAVLERRGRGLVDEPQALDVHDGAGVHERAALRVRVVTRDADGAVARGVAAVRRGRHAVEVRNERRHDLLRPEHRLGAVDRHLHANEAVIHAHELRAAELLLQRHVRLVELAPDEVLQVLRRVVVVGPRDALRGAADEALAVLEGHHGGILPRRRLVQHDVHPSASRRRDEDGVRPEVDAGHRHGCVSMAGPSLRLCVSSTRGPRSRLPVPAWAGSAGGVEPGWTGG